MKSGCRSHRLAPPGQEGWLHAYSKCDARRIAVTRVVLQRDEGIQIGRMTVNRILMRNGLLREEDRHRPATRRFEMSRPNALWQMDFKGQFPMGRGFCYPLSVLDDHSRYLVGLDAMASPSLEGVEGSLIGIFERYGLPESMLMDHGTPWWSANNGHGLTRLSVMLIEQGIQLRYSGVGHPQTQGKVEKWHDTLRRAVRHEGQIPEDLSGWEELLAPIRHNYNQVRPHEGIDMQVPADRLCEEQSALSTGAAGMGISNGFHREARGSRWPTLRIGTTLFHL